jgi:hypothetical protein
MATVDSDSLPTREDIAERLEAQRTAIWQAQGVCGLAASAARHFRNDGERSVTAFTTYVWTALEGVTETLDNIAGALEPDVLCRVPKQGALTDDGTRRAPSAGFSESKPIPQSVWKRGAELAFSMLRQIKGSNLDETSCGDEDRAGPQANIVAAYLAKLKNETDPRCELAFAAILTDHIATWMECGEPDLEASRMHYASTPIATAPVAVQP